MGLPIPAVNSIAKRMQRWEHHHGIQHVVDNLKKLKADLQKPGSQNLIRHSDGSWKGDFRPVWRLAQKGRRGLLHAARILNVYGRWEAKFVSDKHVEDFVRCISTNEPDDQTLTDVTNAIKQEITKEDRYLCQQIVEEASFSDVYPLGPKGSVTSELKIKPREDMSPLDHVNAALALAPNLVDKHLELINQFCLVPAPEKLSRGDIVGVVSGLTKDRGLKVRFVANPLTLFQRVLTRLKDACRYYLECSCPEQAVFNQEKGAKWVQGKLAAGKVITSLDLKSCTDLLPSRPQFDLLLDLFPRLEPDIMLFKDISRSSFIVQPNNQYIEAKWQVGQPLGTEPSFFSFTIFLTFLMRSCGGGPDSFRIIGDDLVMEGWLTDKVVQTYSSLKAPINFNKSIINSVNFAEFAGRWIDGVGVLKLFKATPLRLKSDPMGYIRQYGYKAIKLLPGRYRKMLGILSLFPTPIGVDSSSKVLARIKPIDVNRLFGKKFKSLNPRTPFMRPKIFKKWSTEVVKDVLPFKALFEINETSKNFIEGTTRFQVNYSVREYSFSLLGPFTGCGVWSVKGTSESGLSDMNISIRRSVFNSIVVNIDPVISHYDGLAPMLEKEYSEISKDNFDLEYKVENHDEPKKPLRFYKKVWNIVKGYFPGKFRL